MSPAAVVSLGFALALALPLPPASAHSASLLMSSRSRRNWRMPASESRAPRQRRASRWPTIASRDNAAIWLAWNT